MFQIGDHARVCFVGDSLTAQNKYVARIVDFYQTNFPEKKVNFYNCAVAGGSAVSQYTYLEDYILCRKPTHVILMLGVNDSHREYLAEYERGKERYDKLKEAYAVYQEYLPKLCEVLSDGTEFVLCTPPPYAEYQPMGDKPLPGGSALMAAYAQYVRQLAKEKGYALWDCYEEIQALSQVKELYVEDRIHLNDMGQYQLAKFILKQLGHDLDAFKPLPEYLEEWRRKCLILSHVYAVEWMVLKDYTLPLEEKMARMQDYVDHQRWPDAYFENVAKEYLAYKEKQTELMAEIDHMMEVELKQK